MISKSTIDKILDTAQIVDVINDFVTLKKRGANYIACCPFHNEKTPSFSVSPSKGIFKCFGCGKAGNVVNFIMEHEQLGYVEALKYLGRKYGIEVTDREESAEEQQNRLKSESLMVVSQFASEFYSNTLWNSPSGQAIGLTYFKERGFSEKTIRKFMLGWAPSERDALSNAAIRTGYKKEYLVSAGLSIETENGKLFDRFYERVIFPIHSVSGKVIAFGGRTLKTDKSTAKYINSPESEIYVKSKSLYGIFFAKSAISKFQNCYLVEGYTDVLSLHQAGVENVVASSGTSLTSDQIRLIRRFSPAVTILYDGDAAGIKASIRGIDMLLEEGLQVKVVLFPDGEDPDSFARSHSPEELKEFLKDSEQDFITFKSNLLAEEARQDPLKKVQLISDVVASIAVIPDAISRSVYIEDCSRRLNIDEKVLVQEVRRIRQKKQYGVYSQTLPSEERRYAPEYIPVIRTGEKVPEFVTETFCEPAEKELLYYLLKFGEYPLYGIEEGKDRGITVSQFILTELQNDDLELKNLVYKNMFNEYFLVKEMGQESIQKHFLNHENHEFVQVALELLHQEHTLNIKQLTKTLIPEENVLSQSVPKAILVYKAKITSLAYKKLCEELEKDQNEGASADEQNEVLRKLQILMHIRNSLSKELKRLNI